MVLTFTVHAGFVLPWFVFAFMVGMNGHLGRKSRLKSGNKGMEETKKILKKLPDEYSIFEYVLAEKDGKKTEIDFVVTGKNGVFLLDAINVGGVIIAGKNSDKWEVGRSKINNPIRKSKWQIYMLSRNMRKDGVGGHITGAIYIVGGVIREMGYFQHEDYPVFDGYRSDEFLDFIENNNRNVTDEQLKKLDSWLGRHGTIVR